MTPNSDHPLLAKMTPDGQLWLTRLALENSLDSILIHDTEGRLVYFNQAAADALGLSMRDYANLEPWGFAGDYANVEERERRLQAIKDAGSLTFMSQRALPDGSVVYLEVRTRWVETPGGPLVVAVTHDITERMTTKAALEYLAFHDSLTGLANRALFDDRLEQAIAAARRHGHVMGVAFIDLDDFKEINDEYGHDVGDSVLMALADRLSEAAREEDTVARFGGDEFVIIFPRLSSADDLNTVCDKVRALISQPVALDDLVIDVHASLGIAYFEDRDDDARSLLMRADIAMYRAKRRRRQLGVTRADASI